MASPTQLRLSSDFCDFKFFLYLCSTLGNSSQVARGGGLHTFQFLSMKLNGLMGKGTGRLGNAVFSITNGQQVVRQYNPVVKNPSTADQVNQRAKLKLASQIAAVFAPVIAYSSNGTQSARNRFISKNFKWFYANGGNASCQYQNLQLADGSIGISAVNADRASHDAVVASLSESAANSVDVVVYHMFRVTDENKLALVDSAVVSNAGGAGIFPASLLYTEGQIIVYAYGYKFRNSADKQKFLDYSVSKGSDLADLVSEVTNRIYDAAFSVTRCTILMQGEEKSGVLAAGKARVYINVSGNGVVTGAGIYDIGSEVTVTATPSQGYQFAGWRISGTTALVSTESTYKFTLNGQADLIAVFTVQSSGSNGSSQGQGTGTNPSSPSNPSTTSAYTVTVKQVQGVGAGSDLPANANAPAVTVTNNGSITPGTTCSITVAEGMPEGAKNYSGLYAGNTLLTTQRTYSFVPSADVTIYVCWNYSGNEEYIL